MKKSESTGSKYHVLLQTMSLFVAFYGNILEYDF